MAKLQVTFRGHGRVEFTGAEADVGALMERIRHAMRQNVDTVVTHDLEQEPRSFLCSEIVDLHPVVPDAE